MRGALDVIVRVHDAGRLDELDRAVFSAALQDYRPVSVWVVCQRFGGESVAGVEALLGRIGGSCRRWGCMC